LGGELGGEVMGWWQRWRARQSPAVGDETEWHVVAGGQLLARLREPAPEDMFWFSFQIVPASEPADPRLMDESFWGGEGWRVLGAASGREIGPVIASIQGPDHERRRVRLRGVLR
jgi:hypothetical protein